MSAGAPEREQSPIEAVWSEQGTTPEAIEGALRELIKQCHADSGGYVSARVLNMVAFVDRSRYDEIAQRLTGVGRYHASRLIVLSYDPARTRLDAQAVVAAEGEPVEGEFGLLRETVTVQIGERHLDDLVTIVDPLVVTDLTTLLWSPHGYPDAVDSLLQLAQAILVDSLDEPTWRAAVARACDLGNRAYVVDLSWLRSTPWRERIAAAFDPPGARGELERIESLKVRHHPDSTMAAMMLVGWLASRLGWKVEQLTQHGSRLSGQLNTGKQTVAVELEQAPDQEMKGLESVAIATASGRRVSLHRGAGGLRARNRNEHGEEREWTILGASRGEGGILGEGIRQALLRDPTFRPALAAVETMTP